MKYCPYCLSNKITILTGTVYCDFCQSYFRITQDELVPIFIENKEAYRSYKTQNIDNKSIERILCTVCQERNAMENEKNRIENEQKLKMNKNKNIITTISQNNSIIQQNSILCRECIFKINEKLESDKKIYYEPYKKFVQRKKYIGLLVFVASIAIGIFIDRRASSMLLTIFMIREERSFRYLVTVLMFFLTSWYYNYFYMIFGCFVMASVLNRRRCARIKYLHFNINVEKLQKEILRKIKGLRIGKEKEKEQVKNERSFVHTAYNLHIKKNEEVAKIAKGISNLKIKDTWYGKVDKLVEWLVTK